MSPLLDKIITAVIGAAVGAAATFFVLSTNAKIAGIEDVNDYQGRTILQVIEHVKALEEGAFNR